MENSDLESRESTKNPADATTVRYACRVLLTKSEIDSIVPAWSRLRDAGARGCNFFNDPKLVAASSTWEPSFTPLVVVVERSETLIAVAPFLIMRNQFRLKFSVFTLSSSFAVRLLKLQGNSVIIGSDVSADECLSAVFQALKDQWDKFDLLFLDGVPKGDDLWNYIQTACFRRQGLRIAPAASAPDLGFKIELPSTFDEYFQTLGANSRKTFKKRTKELCERNGGALFQVTRPADVESFLRQADKIYKDSWQAKTYGDRTRCIPSEIARLQQIAEWGWLRSYVLTRGETPLAFQLGYQYRGVFYAMDFAFAQAEADCSPGGVLMHRMFQDLYERQTPQTVDLGHGDSPQKHTFRGSPHEVFFAYVVPRGRSAWFIRLQRMLTSIERCIRSVLVHLRVDRMVRRILKRK